MSNLQVALHLSSTAVYTVVGYATGSSESPRIKVSAVGLANTDAFSGGKIEHREHLLAAIHQSLQAASDMANVQIFDVCLSYASPLMMSFNDWQNIGLDPAPRKVQLSDLYQAVDIATKRLKAEQYDIMQSCQQVVVLDGGTNNKQPIGMLATNIGVGNNIMALPTTYARQVKDLVGSHDVAVEHCLFDGVVSAEYALTKDEKERGVCFVDVGEGTTKVCVYSEGMLVYSSCLDVAGKMVDFDIASEFGLSVREANQLKHSQGTLQLDSRKRASFITIKRNDGAEVTVSLKMLHKVIKARYQHIFDDIWHNLDKAGLLPMIKAGMVLAGGATKIDGLPMLLSQSWGVPVRLMGISNRISVCPKHLSDDDIIVLTERLKDERLHSVLGSLLYQNSEQFIKDKYQEDEPDIPEGLVDKTVHRWQKVSNWFKERF